MFSTSLACYSITLRFRFVSFRNVGIVVYVCVQLVSRGMCNVIVVLDISGAQFSTLGQENWQAEQAQRDYKVIVNEEVTVLLYGRPWLSDVCRKVKCGLGCPARIAIRFNKRFTVVGRGRQVCCSQIENICYQGNSTFLNVGRKISRLESQGRLYTSWLPHAVIIQTYFYVLHRKPPSYMGRKRELIWPARGI